MGTVHRRAIYRGRVQGVGFRVTTDRLATGFCVSGYVKNLSDGTVEVVALGDALEVDGFLAAIERKFAEKIRDCSISDFATDSSEPSGFDVRY